MLFFITHIAALLHVISLANLALAAQEWQDQPFSEHQNQLIATVNLYEIRPYSTTLNKLNTLGRSIKNNFSEPIQTMLQTKVLKTKIETALSVLSNKPKNIPLNNPIDIKNMSLHYIESCIQSVQCLAEIADDNDNDDVTQYLAEQLLNRELPELDALQHNDFFVKKTFENQLSLEAYNDAFRPAIINDVAIAERLLLLFKNNQHTPSQKEHDQYCATIVQYQRNIQDIDYSKYLELNLLLKDIETKRKQLIKERKNLIDLIQTKFIDPTHEELHAHFLDIGPQRHNNLTKTIHSTLTRLYPHNNEDRTKIMPMLKQADNKYKSVMKQITNQEGSHDNA